MRTRRPLARILGSEKLVMATSWAETQPPTWFRIRQKICPDFLIVKHLCELRRCMLGERSTDWEAENEGRAHHNANFSLSGCGWPDICSARFNSGAADSVPLGAGFLEAAA